ncbi:MAG: hypothetical protein ACKOC5_03915 [Chloroflexota bacterium]
MLHIILTAPKFYIDPGTGGLLFQLLAVLLATLSGVLFFFSRQIKSLWARLRRKTRKDPQDQGPQDGQL